MRRLLGTQEKPAPTSTEGDSAAAATAPASEGESATEREKVGTTSAVATMDAAAAAADAASTAGAAEPNAPTPEEIAAAEQKEAQETAYTETLIEKVFVAFNGDVGVSQVRTLGETAEATALLRDAATYMTEALLPRLALEMHERESPIWDSSVIRDTMHSTYSVFVLLHTSVFFLHLVTAIRVHLSEARFLLPLC